MALATFYGALTNRTGAQRLHRRQPTSLSLASKSIDSLRSWEPLTSLDTSRQFITHQRTMANPCVDVFLKPSETRRSSGNVYITLTSAISAFW